MNLFLVTLSLVTVFLLFFLPCSLCKRATAYEIIGTGESTVDPDCHFPLDESSGFRVKEIRGRVPDGRLETDIKELRSEGVRNGALRFDGTDAVVILNNDLLNIGKGDFAVSIFAKRPDTPPTERDNERILAKLPDGDECGGYDITFGRGGIIFRVYAGEKIIGQAEYRGKGLAGRWVHIAAAVDKNGLVELYLNGKRMDHTRLDRQMHFNIENSGSLLIGGRRLIHETPSQGFSGLIDDVRIYRMALNSEQARMLAGALADDEIGTRLSREKPDFISRKPMHELARKRSRPRGMPSYSSVPIRNLRMRPRSLWEKDEISVEKKLQASYEEGGTLWSMQAFHANELEWTYGMTPEFVQEAGKLARSIGSALNAQRTSNETLASKKADGSLVGHHIRGYHGCHQNPDFLDDRIQKALSAVAPGADSLQIDQARMGECFCSHCIEGFRRWLDDRFDTGTLREKGIEDVSGLDYRALHRERNVPSELRHLWVLFNNESVRDFHTELRERLRAESGHFQSLTGNNSSYQLYGMRLEPFDFFRSELMFTSSDPVRLFDRHEEIMEAGKAQSYHPPKANRGEDMDYMVPLTRALIGYTYAMGAWMAAPYDLYIEAGEPRYFGDPAHYADLYGFIRANAKHLDGFERAAFAGNGLADREAGNVLLTEGGSGGSYAFARTRPDEPESPVVIHLVDWGEELHYIPGSFSPSGFKEQTGFNTMSWKRGARAPFTLKVSKANIYYGDSLRARLLTPPAYDEEKHWQAAENGDYSKLSQSKPIEFSVQDGYAVFDIPRLDPYALLVLEPQ